MASLLRVLHLYFVLTFQNWALNPDSFTQYGSEALLSIPLVGWLPRPGAVWLQGMMLLLSLLSLAGVLLAERGRLQASRRLLGLLLLVKAGLTFYDLELLKPFHHMHMLLCALTVLSGVSMARLGVGVIYFTAAWGKLTPSWLAGEYFNSVPGKLPFLPQTGWLVTCLSLAVVMLELLGPWLWLRPAWRKAILASFVAFHIYSGFIVGLFFPLLMLPVLWALFWPIPEQLPSPGRADAPALLILLLVLAGSAWPHVLPGDVRLTGEGQYLSLSNMFDANRSVLFEADLELPQEALSLRVERTYPAAGFYQSPTRLWLQRAGAPRQPVEEPVLWRGQVLINPGLFARLNVRQIGDPYVFYNWMSTVQKRFQPLRLSGSMFVWLNGEKVAWRVFHFEDFGRQAPEYSWLSHNAWLQPERWR